MKTINWKLITTTFVAVAAFSAFTQASEDLFTKLDTNSDGVISKVESEAHEQVSKLFDALDMDKDGVLSAEEFLANQMKG